MDDAKRERYDRTGCSEDESESFWNAYEKFRGIKVTKEDIEAFQSSYKNSKEEEDDLINYFNDRKGDVSVILGFIIGSEDEDRDRFVKFFESELKKKSTKIDKKFRKKFNETKRNIFSVEELDNMEEDLSEEDEQEESDKENDEEMKDFIAKDDDEVGNDYISESSEDEGLRNLDLEIDEVVKVLWKGGTRFYRATITKVRKNKHEKTYDVKYDDGATDEKVKRMLIKKLTNSEPMKVSQKKSKKAAKKAKVDPEYGDLESLKNSILNRASERKSGFDSFARKYAGK